MEFVEVFKQAQRMCNYYLEHGCRECPLSECTDDVCVIRPWESREPEGVERRVMAWAKEHPEPRYPTWKEWLEEQCVISDVGWFKKGYKPIPADIAEKLGLKPKEARD